MASLFPCDPDGSVEALPERVILVRHGETEWNERGVWQGQADIPLSDVGRAQARAVAERLANLAADALVTSDLLRAAETAEIIGARLGLTPVPLPGLRELHVGEWSGLNGEQIAARSPEQFARFRDGLAPAPGGESLVAFWERVMAAFREAVALAPGGTLVQVSHGGTHRNLMAQLLGVPMGKSGRLSSGRNTSLCEIRFRGGAPHVVRMHDTRHLDDL